MPQRGASEAFATNTTELGQSTLEHAAAKEWNDLPKTMLACETLRCFKVETFKFLTESDKTQHICSV